MITKMYQKYKALLLYTFFGGCTTLVDLASYYICTRIFAFPIMSGTLIAWCIAILFAFITNRKWVFHSENTHIKPIMMELAFFVVCRLLTGVLDMGFMYLFAKRLAFPDLFMKIASNIVVILGNNIASRLLIFKKYPFRR